MKAFTSFVACASMLVALSAAQAGVVVEEHESVTRGGKSSQQTRTIVVQGYKQKMTTPSEQVITDLDRHLLIVIHPAQRTYLSMPFPPPMNPPGAMGPAALFELVFHRSGASRAVSGYRCQEYKASGRAASGDYTVAGCFSTEAPGASDFDAFDQKMWAELKGSRLSVAGDFPHGVALELDSTTRINIASIPGLTPQQAEALHKLVGADSLLETRTRVVKITRRSLPPDTFVVPVGYTPQSAWPAPGAARPPLPPPGTKLPE